MILMGRQRGTDGSLQQDRPVIGEQKAGEVGGGEESLMVIGEQELCGS